MTPTNHDDLSNDLGRALHDRADGLIGSPVTLSDVKGRATRIRRRRAIAASAAVAAAVAIIVPTTLAGSDLFDDSSSDAPPATQDATPDPTETGGTAQSWPQRLKTTDLPLGAEPAVPWTFNGVPQGPDAEPSLGYATTRYDDGWLALESTNKGYDALIFDAEGNVLSESASVERFAVSDDGDEVLWVDDDALTLHDNATGEDTVIGSSLGEEVMPQAVEDGTAYYRVRLAGESWPEGRWWADGVEHRPAPGQDVFGWGDVAEDGSVLAMTYVDDFGSCWSLLAPDGSAQGETCDFTLKTFSSDGQHVLAAPAYLDGFGDGEIAVLPADGAAIEDNRVVFHYQREGDADPYFLSSAWEDESHLITVTFTPEPGSANGTWQILRIGLDGSVENAVEPIGADMDAYPFGLA